MATGAITSLGLGSGLELQSILDQLKEIEAEPITRKTNEKTALQNEINAFNSVKAKLFAIKSDALSLSLESDFLNNKVSVSDEEIISARVDNGIVASSTSIDVTQKARASSWQSLGIASKSSVIYREPSTSITDSDADLTTESQTMTIQSGARGSQQNIDIALESGMSLNEIAEAVNSSENNVDDEENQIVQATVTKNSDNNFYIRISSAKGGNSADSQISVAGFDYVKSDTIIAIGKPDSNENTFISIAPGTTYAETADAINNSSDNPGVTAAMIDDGSDENQYKLIITSDSTGENNKIDILNLPMTEVTEGNGESLNAIFTVNGIDYQRQSNEGIDDVITGATLNLKKTGEATVNIQHDMDSVKDHITGLVKGFNELLGEIKGTATDTDDDDTTDTSTDDDDNPLKDSYSIKSMISKLHSLMGTRINTGSEYSSLYDLGMEINKDGTLSLNENTLDQAIASNPGAVKSLFIGNSETETPGLGDIINDGITNMISSQGTITTEISADQKRMDRLDTDIETATTRLSKRYEIMTAEFSKLDIYISQIQSEASYMTAMIDSFNNLDKK
ncbi:MAG: flagellar filament capping protein FliD [Thermodesulfobacteriota bacterium]|nr:flagellar filament capping protein FliD [Thermodesulfobacteriota bacterium]